MKLKQTELTEEFAKQICTWCYEAPYDLYNLSSWEEMCEEAVSYTHLTLPTT